MIVGQNVKYLSLSERLMFVGLGAVSTYLNELASMILEFKLVLNITVTFDVTLSEK